MPTGISGLYKNTKGAKEAEREKVQGMCDFELCEAARAEIEKAKAETAAEIFAELEGLFLDGAIGGKYPVKVINPDKYAELKKNYPKGGADNG